VLQRLRNLIQFKLEQLLLAGSHYRLLVMAGLIALISIVGGWLVLRFDIAHSEASLGEATWWAFLRLTDPGYLGDDEGLVRRLVSTVLTVLGYVIFLGALIAIMTQWLNDTIRRLESGLTPIARRNHIVILGWTPRTPEVLHELLHAEGRVRRFLKYHGARSLQVVVLAEQVHPALVADLRERLGAGFVRRRLILRSGSALRIEHLRRVDYGRAAVIIIPGEEQELPGADPDARVIKVLLTIDHHARLEGFRRLPLLVTALADRRKATAARSAYSGRTEIVANEAILGRLMAQCMRHPGLSYAIDEILSQERGAEIYVRQHDEMQGLTMREATRRFLDAVPIGLLREDTPLLNPPPGTELLAGDRLILLADDYHVHMRRVGAAATAVEDYEPPALQAARGQRRILVLGWTHELPILLAELDQHRQQAMQVDCLSTLPLEERALRLRRAEVELAQVELRQLEGDYAIATDLRQVDLSSYDNILIVGSDSMQTPEDADARTLLGHHLIMVALAEAEHRPQVLVELKEPANADLFDESVTEVLPTGILLSHLLAQVALRHELGAVFDQLLGPGGPEIAFRPTADYGVAGRALDFDELLAIGAQYGEIALGVRRAKQERGGVQLIPRRAERLELGEDDQVIVLTTWD